jgi:moderate conductance mechanosensitive channel
MPDWFPTTVSEVVQFAPLRIAFLVLAGLIVRYVLVRLIDRAVQRAVDAPRLQPTFRPAQALVAATSLPAARREQRINALGSVARSAVSVIISLVLIVMVLAELGFNVSSVVAGTSIVAVALAFGVQSFVKDLFSGVFMLVEDQLGVGDYVDLEKASGVVEEIGLRVTRLRDDDGTVWYVRNGEVLRVGNYSQGGPGRPVAAEPADAPQ